MALNFGKPFLALALSAFLLFTPSPADAGGPDEEGIDAQALIDACWAISLEDRSSGVTGRMRYGGAITVECLEEVILDQIEILFPDGEYLSREQAKQKLDAFAEAVQTMYWSIYNGNIACNPSCGTMWHVKHLGSHARILEDMIRNIVYVRNYHRF